MKNVELLQINKKSSFIFLFFVLIQYKLNFLHQLVADFVRANHKRLLRDFCCGPEIEKMNNSAGIPYCCGLTQKLASPWFH